MADQNAAEALKAAIDDPVTGGQIDPDTPIDPNDNTPIGDDVPADDAPQDESDDDSDDLPIGFVEVEIDGKKQVVPEAVAEAYKSDGGDALVGDDDADPATADTPDPQMQAITQEFQKHVSDRRQVEANMAATTAELEKYNGVDWMALRQQDPESYEDHRLRYQTLRDAKADGDAWLKESNTTVERYQNTVRGANMRATVEFAKKNIPGWTPAYDKAIHTFARKELGFPESDLLNSISPRIYKALHYAYLGHSMTQKINKPSKKQSSSAAGASDAANSKSLRGKNSAPSKPSAKDSLDAWMKKRNAQVSGG